MIPMTFYRDDEFVYVNNPDGITKKVPIADFYGAISGGGSGGSDNSITGSVEAEIRTIESRTVPAQLTVRLNNFATTPFDPLIAGIFVPYNDASITLHSQGFETINANILGSSLVQYNGNINLELTNVGENDVTIPAGTLIFKGVFYYHKESGGPK